jgi:glyoxylase-like metal-dependent hydrolase (beta-lactamase superfamily II)
VGGWRRESRRPLAEEIGVKIGAIQIDPVLDGRILSRLPSNKPLPEPSSQAWLDQHGMFLEDGRIESTVGGFLVRAGDRLALVDAGSGQPFTDAYTAPVLDVSATDDPIVARLRGYGLSDEHLRRMADDFAQTHIEQGALPASLEALGVRLEDITDLVFTHLHFDHIGWASSGGAAYFPNATIRCAAADLDHFLAEPPEEEFTAWVFQALTAADRLAPVLDRIETWDTDTNLFPGVDVRLASGHTPGSSVVVLSDGGAKGMLLGDMIHCPLELMDDDFDLLVDYDQQAAIRVREAYAHELEGGGVVASASHFPGLQFGRLLPGDGVRRWIFEGA